MLWGFSFGAMFPDFTKSLMLWAAVLALVVAVVGWVVLLGYTAAGQQKCPDDAVGLSYDFDGDGVLEACRPF